MEYLQPGFKNVKVIQPRTETHCRAKFHLNGMSSVHSHTVACTIDRKTYH